MKYQLRRLTLTSVCLALLIGAAVTAQAVTLTFEGLGGGNPLYPIPNGYGGLNWTNIGVLDPYALPSHNPSGYVNGIVSGTHVAYNGYGDPGFVQISSATPITLHSAYLTGAWNDGLNVRASGYLGGVRLFSKTVQVSAFAPTLVSYEFTNVDTIVWSSWGGTPVEGWAGIGEHFAMDNLSYDAVPEPSSLLALGTGLMCLLGLTKRRR